MKPSKFFTIRNMVFIAIMAALICVIAPFSVPFPSGIPISLATFAIYIVGAVLGGKKGMAAVVIYILIGMVGLPVFTGFAGGFTKLLGVTGGYIIGYVPCVLITGIFSERFTKKLWAMPFGMVIGTLVLYAFGTAWFVISTGSDLMAAIWLCVVPYLLGDAIKIAAAIAICYPLKDKLTLLMNGSAKRA